MDPNRLRGLGVAMVTPFNEDETVDFEALGNLTDHLINGGADYLVVLGTTAETPTLNKEEQKKVAQFVIEKNKGRLPIMMGLGGNCTKNVLEQIATTDFAGVDCILSVVPYYNRPVQEGIYQHFKAIADASPVPVVLYNVPGRTAANIAAETCLRLAQHPNIIGVKEASSSVEQMKAIIKDRPAGFMMISGDDGLTLPLIKQGGDGVISVIGNAFPERFSRSIHAALNGDMEKAEELYAEIGKFTDYLFVDGNPPGIKALLHEMGMIKNVVRLPIVPATTSTQNKLSGLLKGLN
ncbi:4-hydroxy-tetrahydrodipicolinate synthase [Saccharicrinis sp. FJH54]|uniref:4-hydroxy-tetrahydrodipicolinate synthase n=1 Tax=Saccharicrinis sp. FJH54 TaxID=3344665 RepID=UPI0035D3EA6A